MIFKDVLTALSSAYPDEHARLYHELSGDKLFELSALVDLSRRLPASSVEYNIGDLAIDQDPAKTPMNSLSAEEAVRRIKECNSWVVMKNVEADPNYRRAMDECLSEIAPVVEAATGKMHRQQAYVFVSSPGAVTPFHMDPEHNILMQIEGSKIMYIYSESVGRNIPQECHEAFHAGVGHRNLRYRDAYETQAREVKLEAGGAVYVPVKAPHRVQNGAGVSISFSVTWRSKVSDEEARLHLANRALRLWGAQPRPPAVAPIADAAKIFSHKVTTRLREKY